MEHAGLFRDIVLVHLMVCSHVGLLKIVAFGIYQTESITMLKSGTATVVMEMALGRSGLSCGNSMRSVAYGCFYSVELRMDLQSRSYKMVR